MRKVLSMWLVLALMFLLSSCVSKDSDYINSIPLNSEHAVAQFENPYNRGDGSSDFMPISRYEMFDIYSEYWFNETQGMYGKSPASQADGGYLNIVNINGERFIDFSVHGLAGNGNVNFCLKGHNTYYMSDFSGFPDCISVKDFWGFAIRIKQIDNGTNPGFHFYFNIGTSQNWLNGGTTYYIIDNTTKTWSKKIISSSNRIHLGNMDGWLLISFKEFTDVGFSYQEIQTQFSSLQPFLRSGANYANGNWIGTKLYIGDTVVVQDVNKFTEKYAPNTKNKLQSIPHNNVTDKSIPAVMVNDCSGAKIGDGLYNIEGAKTSVSDIKKPNEKSKSIRITTTQQLSSVYFQNDALNLETVTQKHQWQIMDSIGVSFYIKLDGKKSDKIGFDVKSSEGPEKFSYKNNYYYTVSNGVATKNYGAIELRGNFEGNLIIPSDNFTYDLEHSTNLVDGTFFSPDLIDYFAFQFDQSKYPSLCEASMIVDDILLYQNQDAFITKMLKIQGTDKFSIKDGRSK